MTARTYFFVKSKSNFRAVFPSLFISAVCHFIFVLILVYTPGQHFDKKIKPAAINVSLVSMPAPFPETDLRQEKRSMKRRTKRVTPKRVTNLSKANPEVSKPLKEKKKPKISLKKKTFKTAKVVKRAIKEIEKRIEDTRPDPIAKALERMKEKVEQTQADELDQTTDDIESEAAPASASAAGEKRALEQIDIYKLEITYMIEKNWAFPEQMAGKHADLESVLVIKVMPNGDIKDIWFEKKSGNPHLDESAYKAILKSDPLPPLPAGYIRPYFTVGMLFTPSGLR